jgi:YesN/AraC family two-component response regulator
MASIAELLEKSKYGITFKGSAKVDITKKLQRLLKLPPFEKFLELLKVLHSMALSEEYELLNPSSALSQLTRKNNGRLQDILSYVEKHYNEEIDIKKAASIANLSVPSFCNYFKKLMSFTYTDFINQYRIHKACIMMKQEKNNC